MYPEEFELRSYADVSRMPQLAGDESVNRYLEGTLSLTELLTAWESEAAEFANQTRSSESMSDRLHTPFVIGMDGGGTKTKACIADLEGKVIDALEGGSMNVNSAGRDGVIQNITALLQAIQKRGWAWNGLRGLCLAAAGVSNPLTREVLEEAVRQAGIGIRPIIIGDHQAALYGAHRGGTGMILIAGTGSVCYGKNEQGQEARSGGFGHLIDDEGSAYALAETYYQPWCRQKMGVFPLQ